MSFSTGFFLYSGWGSRSQCVTQGLEVSKFVIQDDMKGRSWVRPGNSADIITPAKLVDSISGGRGSYGGIRFDWNMQGLSPKMVKYIRDTFFAGGYSAKMTVQTFNRGSGDWECYQVYGKMPNEREAAEPVAGGYNNYIITFVGGVLAPESHDLELSVSYSGEIQTGGNLDLSITLNNVGDAPTYSTTSLTLELANGNELSVVSTPSGWSDEFSDDGATYYNTILSAPFNQDDVTHIRWTRTLPIAAGYLANFQVEWDFTIGGPQTNTLTLISVGDKDDTDNILDILFNPPTKGFSSGFDLGYGV